MPRYTTRPQRQTFRTIRLPSGPVTIASEVAYRRARAAANAALSCAYDNHSLWSDGETEGREVHDDGTWSEDQSTGLLNASGEMSYRERNSIGFMADN